MRRWRSGWWGSGGWYGGTAPRAGCPPRRTPRRRTMTIPCWLVVWLAYPGLPDKVPAAEARPGIVFVMGGVGGIDPLGWSARWALPRAGVPHEVREFIWTHGRGRILKDLQDHEHLLQMAAELAGEVQQIKAASPQRRIWFLAKSGGTGLALAA